MSTFNSGGGTLKSANKPQALLEMAHALASTERAASTTDIPLNNITISMDLEAQTAAVTCTLPIAAALNNSGQVVVTASDYLSGYAFNPGSGDLRAINYPAAFLEVAQTVAVAEKAVVTNPPNNITIAFDLEAGTAAISATLPVISAIDANGKISVAATDYLP